MSSHLANTADIIAEADRTIAEVQRILQRDLDPTQRAILVDILDKQRREVKSALDALEGQDFGYKHNDLGK